MAATSHSEPTLIEPVDLEAVGAALCCRFGEASAEARRLATLHDVLGTSRALARALDDFARTAGTHYKGIHCSPDMNAEVQRLTRSLAAWSESGSSVTKRRIDEIHAIIAACQAALRKLAPDVHGRTAHVVTSEVSGYLPK